MSEENNIEQTPQNNKKKNTKRILLWGGAILLLLLSIIIFFVSMLFTSPNKEPYPQPTAIDYYTQSRIASKIYRQIRKTPDKLCSMNLKESEVNSAIRCAVFAHGKLSNKKSNISAADLRLKYANGLFYGVVPLDTGCRFLNGGVIEISFAAKICKNQGPMMVDVVKAKAGSFNLPTDKVNAKVKEFLASEKAKKQLAALDNILEGISPREDGGLQITYYPQNLMYVVIQQINKTGAF